MKNKNLWIELLMTFMTVTACVTILEGILGGLFMPETKLSYAAFFSPPLFGLLSAIASLVTYSRKELTIRQAMFRKVIHLMLIEVMVLGVNAMAGNFYGLKLVLVMILSVAIVYVTVNLVMYANEQRSAVQFNENLKSFQDQIRRKKQEE